METITIDASKEPLGRLATKTAVLLMGKNKASFERNRVPNVRVVITRSNELVLTGRKELQKRYYRHSGRIGNLREATAQWMREHDSRVIIRNAVAKMLPKNRLRAEMLKHLTIYKTEPQ